MNDYGPGADLWVLVPSRGRPANVERLVRACALTCAGDTRLHFAFDADDEHLAANIAAAAGHRYTTGPRQGLAAWTNDLAARHIRRVDAVALASLGDDMVPKTHGWDIRLLEAARARGASYPQDGRRADIPEAIVIMAQIVAALGWMAHPSMKHFFIDNVWADLLKPAYLPDVLISHLHPQVRGGDPTDRTYLDAAGCYDADLAAYQRWRLTGMRSDAETVRQVIACTVPV